MDNTPIFLSNIVIFENRIAYIGEDYKKFSPFDVIRECNGNVVMPGFKNVHTHSAMTFLRSCADDLSLQDWLFNVVFPRERHLKVEDPYHLSKVAFLEYLTSGITACYDQYFYPLSTAKAAEEFGMRAVLQGTYSNYTSEENLKDYYFDFNSSKNSLVTYVIGLHAEYTSENIDYEVTSRVLKETKSPFATHTSETLSEVEECKKRHNGFSPIQFFESLGFYENGGVAFHCNYLDDKDIEIFKKHNVSVVTCPGSNSKLASGICPVSKYLESGLNVCIGTDGPASNNCLDMFKEMQLVYSLGKLQNSDPKALPAYEILKMATVNGAHAMGLFDADILEVNKLADLIEIDLTRPNMQPLNSIVNNIVYSGSKDIIKMTMINGKILYDDGEFFVGQPIEEIYNNCQLVADRLDKEAR